MEKLLLKDNLLTRMLNRMVDCIWLSILWTIASVPLLTVGTASEALYYTVHKCIYQEEGHIFSTFFKTFWANRKQGTVLWLIMAPVGLLLASGCYLVFQWSRAGMVSSAILVVSLGAAGLCIMWMQYWFAYAARFEDTVRGVLQNTFLIAYANFGTSFLLMIVFVLVALIVSCLPQFIVLWMIFPGLYVFAVYQAAENLFKKYLPREQESEDQENDLSR